MEWNHKRLFPPLQSNLRNKKVARQKPHPRPIISTPSCRQLLNTQDTQALCKSLYEDQECESNSLHQVF